MSTLPAATRHRGGSFPGCASQPYLSIEPFRKRGVALKICRVGYTNPFILSISGYSVASERARLKIIKKSDLDAVAMRLCEMPSPKPNHRLTRRPSLLGLQELPDWYRDNQYILTGYRPVANSVLVCLKSLRYTHNESVNIFTHLIPGVLAPAASWYLHQWLSNHFPRATGADKAVFIFQLLAAACCLSMSAAFHTFINHSHDLSSLWARLDYTGIVVLILADFISGIYFGFYCNPSLQKIYWTMICSLGGLTLFVVLHSKYQSLKYRTLRLATFIATGMSAFAPIIHVMQILPYDQLTRQTGLNYYYLEGGLVLAGALAYGFRWPERWQPGRYDIWGASHQIFHILVVFATVVHLKALYTAFTYNYEHAACR